MIAGVCLDGQPMGGKTVGEVAEWLDIRAEEILFRPVRIEYEGRSWELPLKELGVEVDRHILEELDTIGHRGWMGQRFWEWWKAKNQGVNFPLRYTVDQGRLLSSLRSLTEPLVVPPQDAFLRVSSDDVITVVPSRDGRGPELEAAYPQLLSILESSQDLRIKVAL